MMPTAVKLESLGYIGIDPGQSGGLACLEPFIPMKGDIVILDAMPSTERDTWNWFKRFSPTESSRKIAVIEKVHAMPKQGVSSTFKFGVGYGGLRMALIAAGIPFEEVTPQVWQKALSITARKKTENKGQFKNRLLAKTQQLFPQLPIWSEPKSKGRQLAVCDALLIAEYCKRKHEGNL